ncbi:hypothetical protein OPT61_g1370 [Boeremia exigua]|uniref:Uncharacterized protein n=1 Tax=Boeremia exigua TaxID=749465 RepID=A0ACC2IQD8_9PLEO|nr:hypothetical protein OPT61_g1370 [Boeremia exigua]
MRLNLKDEVCQVGNVELNAISHVTELDSGLVVGPNKYDILEDGNRNVSFSQSSLRMIEGQMAIIVPCMNEEHYILNGVLHGIPHHCLIILVSNSNVDNFKVERDMLNQFCTDTQRTGIVAHQQDLGLARAFAEAGMPHITTSKAGTDSQDDLGRVRIRNGKGEAMMIGTALAKIAGKAFVGFIDADNFVPGAVHEYCKIFAAGLSHALHSNCSSSSTNTEPLAMVRLKWKSKPKIVEGKLIPQESGRCSRVVNEWMDRLLASFTGEKHQDLIKTANAGEHAMSTDLALQLQFATGYAVEPFQLIDAWERSGILPPSPPGTPPRCDVETRTHGESRLLGQKVKVLQIETLNPHVHDFGKGEEHILKMQAQGLSTIYHSKLMPEGLKHQLANFMSNELSTVVGTAGVPQEPCVYPPMESINFDTLRREMMERAEIERFDGTVSK